MSWTREEAFQSTREERIDLKTSISHVRSWLDINAGKFPADFPEHIAIICGALHKRLEHEDRNEGTKGPGSRPVHVPAVPSVGKQ